MPLVNEVYHFLKTTQPDFFIEAEAKPDRMENFLRDYNSRYGQKANSATDGIVFLKEDANKRGLELRIYFYSKTGLPKDIHATHNDQYRVNYSYRINDVDLVWELFDLGCRIGLN